MSVIQSKDKNGYFYKSENGDKFYYTAKDKESRLSAKSQAKLLNNKKRIIEMNNYVEICEMNPEDITGRSKIRLVFHEIYDSSDDFNKNGISWNEQYTNNNKESAIGMPLVVQFLDETKEIPVGHGVMEIDEDGEIHFKDSEVVGTIEEAYVSDIKIDGVIKKVFMGDGYLYNQRYPNFVKWLKDTADITKIKGSIEIGKKTPNESIIYDGGYKEKGRIPQIYDYTGHAILFLEEPADDSAILVELNNKISENEVRDVSKKTIKGKTFEMNALNYYDICAIITKAFNKLMNPNCNEWCCDYGIYKFYPTESYVIFQSYSNVGEYWKVPYTVTNGAVTLGDSIEVEEDWKPTNEAVEAEVDLSSLKEDFINKNKKEINDDKGGSCNMDEKQIADMMAKMKELTDKVDELNNAVVEANKVIEAKNEENSKLSGELNSLKAFKAEIDATKKQEEVNAYFEKEIKKNGFTEAELNSLKTEYVDKCDLEGLKMKEMELCVKKIKEINTIQRETELNTKKDNEDLFMSIHNEEKSDEDCSDLY